MDYNSKFFQRMRKKGFSIYILMQEINKIENFQTLNVSKSYLQNTDLIYRPLYIFIFLNLPKTFNNCAANISYIIILRTNKNMNYSIKNILTRKIAAEKLPT